MSEETNTIDFCSAKCYKDEKGKDVFVLRNFESNKDVFTCTEDEIIFYLDGKEYKIKREGIFTKRNVVYYKDRNSKYKKVKDQEKSKGVIEFATAVLFIYNRFFSCYECLPNLTDIGRKVLETGDINISKWSDVDKIFRKNNMLLRNIYEDDSYINYFFKNGLKEDFDILFSNLGFDKFMSKIDEFITENNSCANRTIKNLYLSDKIITSEEPNFSRILEFCSEQIKNSNLENINIINLINKLNYESLCGKQKEIIKVIFKSNRQKMIEVFEFAESSSSFSCKDFIIYFKNFKDIFEDEELIEYARELEAPKFIVYKKQIEEAIKKANIFIFMGFNVLSDLKDRVTLLENFIKKHDCDIIKNNYKVFEAVQFIEQYSFTLSYFSFNGLKPKKISNNVPPVSIKKDQTKQSVEQSVDFNKELQSKKLKEEEKKCKKHKSRSKKIKPVGSVTEEYEDIIKPVVSPEKEDKKNTFNISKL